MNTVKIVVLGLFLSVLLGQGFSVTTNVTYTCYNSSVVLKTTDNGLDVTNEYLPCEFGCYDGACADKSLEAKNGLAWLFIGVSGFFLALFIVLKRDVLGVFGLVASLMLVALALFVFASPVGPETVTNTGMAAASGVFWLVVGMLLFVLVRAVFGMVETAFRGR